MVAAEKGSSQMKRHWNFLLGLALLVASCGICLVIIEPFHESVRAYGRIRLGMTPLEVEGAIGLPPGDYAGFGPQPLSMSGHVLAVSQETGIPFSHINEEQHRVDCWDWPDYTVWVYYDSSFKVDGFYLVKFFGGRRTS